MCKLDRILVAAIVIVLAGGAVYGAAWTVGEKWVYKHEGPRPHGDGTGTVEGDRTVEVTAIRGEGAEKRYLLRSLWGTGDANPATAYIDPNNMLHKLDIENMVAFTMTPPVPAIWSLKIGEEKVVKTNLDLGGFLIPFELRAKRLKDETVTVPAGTFEGCQHIQVVTLIQNEVGEPVKNKSDLWYHPKVRNSVKEVIVTNFESEQRYSAASLLKSHTTKK